MKNRVKKLRDATTKDLISLIHRRLDFLFEKLDNFEKNLVITDPWFKKLFPGEWQRINKSHQQNLVSSASVGKP